MRCSDIKVIKKDGTREDFNVQKVVVAVNKSANRAMITFSRAEINFICQFVEEKAEQMEVGEIPIAQMHNIVEGALERVNPLVAKSYRDYRNYSRISCRCWMRCTKRASPSCTSETRKTAIRTAPWYPPRGA